MGESMSTAPKIRERKVIRGDEPLVMVTAYDAPSARIADEAGVDIILVGDSVAMVVLGYTDTLQVTVADIAHHTAAVWRAGPSCHVVADMPWLSYHVSVEDTIRNAATLIRAGAQSVKLEGGAERVAMIEALVAAEIPVMGHIGLTPQSVNAMGGFRVQGKSVEATRDLIEDAKRLADAGVYSIVLEGVPEVVGDLVTRAIDVPTIGIGAGPRCDGQVLVFHDLVGLENRMRPKFARRYADLHEQGVAAVNQYAKDVRAGTFPGDAESYQIPDELAAELEKLR
jgi:3-methyl-2-oxobutanoate hydroxymethyltransferase